MDPHPNVCIGHVRTNIFFIGLKKSRRYGKTWGGHSGNRKIGKVVVNGNEQSLKNISEKLQK